MAPDQLELTRGVWAIGNDLVHLAMNPFADYA